MSYRGATYYIHQLKRQYFWMRLGESVLWAFAVTLLALSLTWLFSIDNELSIILSVSAGIIAMLSYAIALRLFTIDDPRLVHYINQHYPDLEESTDLLLRNDEQQSPLQQLQKQIILSRFEKIHNEIKLPHKLLQASASFALALILFIGLSAFEEKKSNITAPEGKEDAAAVSQTALLPSIVESISIDISPPLYTNLTKSSINRPNISVVEGSSVSWSVKFSTEIKKSFILFAGQDSVDLKSNDNKIFKVTERLFTSGFYQIVWIEKDGTLKFSDYYKVEVIKDHPPQISIEELNQFIILSYTDKLTVNVKASLSDDYGLTDAYIIATVSKGSGESVKFREEKLLFSSPERISGKKISASKTIDLNKLGLEPGDELYYYIFAKDNKAPIPQYSRTETYFISLQDTTSNAYFSDSGLGVDLMPEYFRSQRQIIIDSEKLLAEKKRIDKQEFNARSNELGYDQKVLRLRYGQFLGEEFESGIGIQQEFALEDDYDHDHDHDDEDIISKFGHVHDRENEHNHVEIKREAHNHNHSHDNTDPDKKENPLDAFLHAHDSEEEATFFIQSIKTKLKAAITVMWDAELHLRLYDPEKSLPYQYQALNLLKEISQDSRIYVHRMGFDPPPIKEEKRLSGDLTELKSKSQQYHVAKEKAFPAIQNALIMMQRVLHKQYFELTTSDKVLLTKVGQELSIVALQNPKYIEYLSAIKALTENDMTTQEQRKLLLKIQQVCWEILPREQKALSSGTSTLHPLDRQFIQTLESLKN